MKKIKRGFTLIEVLIAISIVAILVALTTIAYSSAQKRGRDNRRRGDMLKVQQAFEQYYTANNTYNSNCQVMLSSFVMGSVTDPKTRTGYTSTSCGARSYCWCASMEIASSGNSNNGSCSFGSGNFYCVTSVLDSNTSAPI